MSGVPFLYINVSALCCFALLFTTLAASKKNTAIRTFMVVLIGFMVWTGGSILMRLQVKPGVEFWYYVSISALFTLPVLIYFFVCSITGRRGFFMKLVWCVATVCILIPTCLGVFLAPPTVQLTPDGYVFLYRMEWLIAIPCVFCLLVVVSIAQVFRDVIRENGLKTPGLRAILGGCLSVALGNMVQIIPGNTFPFDTLSGTVFALLLMAALYKKHMFRLTLSSSRSLVMAISSGIVVFGAVEFLIPSDEWIAENLPAFSGSSNTLSFALFALLLLAVWFVVKRITDTLFSREEKQTQSIRDYSDRVAKSLDMNQILSEMTAIIRQATGCERLYISLPDQVGDFVIRHSSMPLSETHLVIRRDSPVVRQLAGGDIFFKVNQFRSSPGYLSMWQEEKLALRAMDLDCVAALKNDNTTVGLVLLGKKDRDSGLSHQELDYLATIVSITSIAVKNASLYERMCRQARTDSLTGVYNYAYYVESINRLYAQYGQSGLALLYVDLDDFKLYNQMYGAKDGDVVLQRVAETLVQCMGSGERVFRSSGKVFALLLPGYDAREALNMAQEVISRVAAISREPQFQNRKAITVSCGICVSPNFASSAKELMDNADLAVFTAKNSGKGGVNLFSGSAVSRGSLAQRSQSIIDKIYSQEGTIFSSFLPTVNALTAAIDAKDHYTYYHSQNVAVYSTILAVALGLSEDQISVIYEAGLLHDIGKISIPEDILGKTGKLTPDEYATIQKHVNNSIDIIRHLPNMDYLIPSAVGHHERWDGKGYPRGISGEDIPIGARCLAVADAYDAMTTNRPYRTGLSADYAVSQIEAGAGTQFDPQIAQVFVQLVRTGNLHT